MTHLTGDIITLPEVVNNPDKEGVGKFQERHVKEARPCAPEQGLLNEAEHAPPSEVVGTVTDSKNAYTSPANTVDHKICGLYNIMSSPLHVQVPKGLTNFFYVVEKSDFILDHAANL